MPENPRRRWTLVALLIAMPGNLALQLSNIQTPLGAKLLTGNALQMKIALTIPQALIGALAAGAGFLILRRMIASKKEADRIAPAVWPVKGTRGLVLLRGGLQICSATSMVIGLIGFVELRLNVVLLSVFTGILLMCLPTVYKTVRELMRGNRSDEVIAGIAPAVMSLTILLALLILEPSIVNGYLLCGLVTAVLGSFVPLTAQKIAQVEGRAIGLEDIENLPPSRRLEGATMTLKAVSMGLFASTLLGLLVLGGLSAWGGWQVGLAADGMTTSAWHLAFALLLFVTYQLMSQWAIMKGSIPLNSSVSALAIPLAIPFGAWWLNMPITRPHVAETVVIFGYLASDWLIKGRRSAQSVDVGVAEGQ